MREDEILVLVPPILFTCVMLALLLIVCCCPRRQKHQLVDWNEKDVESVLEKKQENRTGQERVNSSDLKPKLGKQKEYRLFSVIDEILPSKRVFPRERLILGDQIGAGAFGRVVKAEAAGLNEYKSPSSKMVSKEEALRFLDLFECIGEPLHEGARGHNFRKYSAQLDTVDAVTDDSAPCKTDISNSIRVCPRETLYNNLNPTHRVATMELLKQFLVQGTSDEVYKMIKESRHNPDIHPKLWLYASSIAILSHQACQRITMPAVWQIMPDQFFDYSLIQQAVRRAAQADLEPLILNNFKTGHDTNPENRMAYFREDPGLNSHHWHWHILYSYEKRSEPSQRTGELFSYMHQGMIARYDAERLSNNLLRVRPFSIDHNPVIKEGYFSKLYDTQSGKNWGTRQSNTPLAKAINIEEGELKYTLQQVRKWRDRIEEAIDTGRCIGPNGELQELNIDMLGHIMEASKMSENTKYYGARGIHNVGHLLIGYSHDPTATYLENGGVMTDTATACRDPVFFRWHKYIDDIFDSYKVTLKPHELEGGEFPLTWPTVSVIDVSLKSKNDDTESNKLHTYLRNKAVNLNKGLDFQGSRPVFLQFTHLDHDPFEYRITVNSEAQVRATVRIYMAPQLDECGKHFTLSEQRRLFFEMDKFTQNLEPGKNVISRSSTQSSVTVPWEQTFEELEQQIEADTLETETPVCGCGWPQHLLLPKGFPGLTGQTFDFLVFLTNTEDDSVDCENCPNQRAGKREGLSYCGREGQPYPDKKPMGYPFDRKPYTVLPNGRKVEKLDLKNYVQHIPNMHTVQVSICHDPDRHEIVQPDGKYAPKL